VSGIAIVMQDERLGIEKVLCFCKAAFFVTSCDIPLQRCPFCQVLLSCQYSRLSLGGVER
jgi:hypothetical protein